MHMNLDLHDELLIIPLDYKVESAFVLSRFRSSLIGEKLEWGFAENLCLGVFWKGILPSQALYNAFADIGIGGHQIGEQHGVLRFPRHDLF